MTTEYLRGEVLQFLEWAQQVGPCRSGPDRAMGALRQEAQSTQVDDLAWVVERALAVAESWCWDAMTAADFGAFRDRCRFAAALYDFGVCSDLLVRGSVDSSSIRAMIWRKGPGP